MNTHPQTVIKADTTSEVEHISLPKILKSFTPQRLDPQNTLFLPPLNSVHDSLSHTRPLLITSNDPVSTGYFNGYGNRYSHSAGIGAKLPVKLCCLLEEWRPAGGRYQIRLQGRHLWWHMPSRLQWHPLCKLGALLVSAPSDSINTCTHIYVYSVSVSMCVYIVLMILGDSNKALQIALLLLAIATILALVRAE